MSKQFEQLEFLHKQILLISQKIRNYIEKENYDEVLSQENYKSQLNLRVELAQKTIDLTEEETNIIKQLRSQIAESEKTNLDMMTELRDKIVVELKALNSQSKISNKYAQKPEEPQEGTICDYTSD